MPDAQRRAVGQNVRAPRRAKHDVVIVQVAVARAARHRAAPAVARKDPVLLGERLVAAPGLERVVEHGVEGLALARGPPRGAVKKSRSPTPETLGRAPVWRPTGSCGSAAGSNASEAIAQSTSSRSRRTETPRARATHAACQGCAESSTSSGARASAWVQERCPARQVSPKAGASCAMRSRRSSARRRRASSSKVSAEVRSATRGARKPAAEGSDADVGAAFALGDGDPAESPVTVLRDKGAPAYPAASACARSAKGAVRNGKRGRSEEAKGGRNGKRGRDGSGEGGTFLNGNEWG